MMNNNNQENYKSLTDLGIDVEALLASVDRLSLFNWVNNSDQDQLLHVRLFSPESPEPFEHTYYLIPGVTSWFTLSTGTAYFHYNTQPLAPLEMKDKRTYYIVIHKDGTIQCGSDKK